MTDETLLRHINLLQQEFQRVNNKYQLLKHKYEQLSLASGNCSTEDNFFVNLNKIVRGLYKDKKYSDISIQLQKNTIPGHKIVFEANGWELSQSDFTHCEEILLNDIDQCIGEQIIKWLYLQEFNDNQSHEIIWKIMKVAHDHNLIYLKHRCITGLVSKLTKDNCIYFYSKASELVVENLRKLCSELIISNWNEFQSSDFNCLSASIFLELLESQSSYPLHEAVKANRDDVVFLYINEHFSELEDLVNVINDNNELVLDLALSSKRVELCQTLLANCANPNCVDKDGWSLLHKAIFRFDEFSACFLIQNGCHLNPLSPDNLQTPLQLTCYLIPTTDINEGIVKMNKISHLLIQGGADVNHVDNNNLTALCYSILSGNETIVKYLLNSGRCTTVNGASYLSPNRNKYKSPTIPRVTSYINVSPLPLWLALCREYHPELLKIYPEFKDEQATEKNLTSLLINHDADPGCLFNADTGNSLLMETVLHNMEDAALFVLESMRSKREKLKSNASSLVTLINMTNNFKESVLHIAVENELIELCRMLLELGADPNLIRRRPVVINVKDDMSSSCDSVNSSSSLKKDDDSLSSNETHLVRKSSSNSFAIFSLPSKTENLNPFKDYMKVDVDSDDILSISMPPFHKSDQSRSSVIDVINNKKTKHGTNKSRLRSTLKIQNQDKQPTIDLCTPTHLAVKSRNLKIIDLFINHDDDGDYRVNWLLTDASGESAFTLTLWNGLVSVADMIFRKLVKTDFKTSQIDQITINGHHLLHLAVLRNNIETVQFLIKIGCAINVRSSSGITPLQLATDRSNIEIVRILCLSSADPNIICIDNSSENPSGPCCPLWAALINERFDIAEILAEAGADVDMWSTDPRDDYEQTLLHRAILNRKEASARFLISHDCDIRSPRESKGSETPKDISVIGYTDGNTPLHMACQYGLETVVKALLSNKEINVNSQNVHGLTALHLAIRFQQEAVLAQLLDPKFKVNLSIPDNQGHTPFHTAMEMSNQKAARSILQHHPNAADEVDNLGRNFLHVAVQTMNRQALFFLIQVNAHLNVRVKDAYQYTPLHLAIISGAPEDMIRSLILAGARLEDETIEKQNLLHLAVIYERTYLVNFLLENGASTSHQDNQLETPLHLAIKSANKAIIEQLLISSSTTIKTKNLKGDNILHILANNAKENAVVIFSLIMELYSNFPIDEKDACGNTAMFLCACNGHVRLAVSLLMKGASLGCVNNDGLTLFNCDISENILVKLLDSLDNEPLWWDGESCVSCSCKFSITNRKHHCRHCGRLVCGKCSDHEIPLIKYNIKKPVRVCDICFNFLVNGKCRL